MVAVIQHQRFIKESDQKEMKKTKFTPHLYSKQLTAWPTGVWISEILQNNVVPTI